MSFFNFFSKAKNAQQKKLKKLSELSATFTTLEKMEKEGLLYWKAKERQFIVEQSLAMIMLSQGASKWRNFLENILLWQSYRLAQQQAEADRINVEAKAVREARKKYANLTTADINRIRTEARINMPVRDVKTIEAFDIFIIRTSAISANDATEATGELVAIGHYDIDGNHDIALWDDVKHNLQTK